MSRLPAFGHVFLSALAETVTWGLAGPVGGGSFWGQNSGRSQHKSCAPTAAKELHEVGTRAVVLAPESGRCGGWRTFCVATAVRKKLANVAAYAAHHASFVDAQATPLNDVLVKDDAKDRPNTTSTHEAISQAWS